MTTPTTPELTVEELDAELALPIDELDTLGAEPVSLVDELGLVDLGPRS